MCVRVRTFVGVCMVYVCDPTPWSPVVQKSKFRESPAEEVCVRGFCAFGGAGVPSVTGLTYTHAGMQHITAVCMLRRLRQSIRLRYGCKYIVKTGREAVSIRV